MPAERPKASVSLDLDDLWTYLRTRGNPKWLERPSYLSAFVPRVLDLLDELNLRITFFIVGCDTLRSENVPYIRAIADRGHEIGNHSFWHECWLQRYSSAQLDEEIGRAHRALCDVTGQQPRGFRGPGFSWSPELLETLAAHGYTYDASTLPTFLGPLARLYFLAAARLSPEERAERSLLFGSFRDGFRPNRPYQWRLRSGRRLLELPVTTVPGIRTPFHMSYLLYLSRFSTSLMRVYLDTALGACRLLGVPPSFLLHPLDLLGPEEAPELEFFPGMDLTGAVKQRLVCEALVALRASFDLVTMGEVANEILAAGPARSAVALAT